MIAEAADRTQMTIDEPWTVEAPEEGHVYNAACDFALRTLGPGNDRRCLVVGSPLFEMNSLRHNGWRTMLVDVRRPPDALASWTKADASALPFAGGFVDALSSTCVLCHVGLGRYGDPIVPNGDRLALKEFARVLKPGGKAAVCFGPCVMVFAKTLTMGRLHRVYSTNDAMDMAEEAGLVPFDAAVWCSCSKRWLNLEELDDRARAGLDGDKVPYCYLMMALEKPA